MKVFLLLSLLSAIAMSLKPEQASFRSQIRLIDDVDQQFDLSTTDALLDLHRKLVEIESITGNEKKVGKWLASYLEEQNLTVELQEAEINRFNVFAYPGKERKTDILVTSHIDTVLLRG